MIHNANLFPVPTTPSCMNITPEIAANWLENRNAQAQRRMSEGVALKYAKIMKSGRWLFTHQGIAFDYDGFLIDGQHRLRAVVISGIAVEMFVIPNCDPATFAVLDNGHKRQAAHLLHGPNPKVVASAARILAVVTGYARRDGRVEGGVYDGTLPTDVILEVCNQWPELEELMSAVQNCYNQTKINRPMHLAVAAQAVRSRYRDRLGSWFDGLYSGAELGNTDPRLHLRNRFMRDGAILAYGHNQCYNLIMKAWNAHAQQRNVGVLRVREEEGVIQIVG